MTGVVNSHQSFTARAVSRSTKSAMPQHIWKMLNSIAENTKNKSNRQETQPQKRQNRSTTWYFLGGVYPRCGQVAWHSDTPCDTERTVMTIWYGAHSESQHTMKMMELMELEFLTSNIRHILYTYYTYLTSLYIWHHSFHTFCICHKTTLQVVTP